MATCFIEADGDLMGERQIHRKLDERVTFEGAGEKRWLVATFFFNYFMHNEWIMGDALLQLATSVF